MALPTAPTREDPQLQQARAKLAQLEQLLKQGRTHLQALRTQLDETTKERDALRVKLETAVAERDAALSERDDLRGKRDEMSLLMGALRADAERAVSLARSIVELHKLPTSPESSLK